MAQVYLAETFGASGFEKRVAIKLLRPEHRGVSEFERLLIAEATLGAKLNHRNLVAINELSVIDGCHVVAMEYVDGVDLAGLLGQGKLPVAVTLFIADELAIALDYLHQANDIGLVHRDISPSNILISSAGEVKLADLGIAKATTLADATQGNVRKGKYAYMSPEQICGDALQSSSDQFSLGIVLYQMLTGRRPFDGATVLATMENIKQAQPPPINEVPPELAKIVLRCLARQPSDRYASAATLQRDIAAARRLLPNQSSISVAAWVQSLATEA